MGSFGSTNSGPNALKPPSSSGAKLSSKKTPMRAAGPAKPVATTNYKYDFNPKVEPNPADVVMLAETQQQTPDFDFQDNFY